MQKESNMCLFQFNIREQTEHELQELVGTPPPDPLQPELWTSTLPWNAYLQRPPKKKSDPPPQPKNNTLKVGYTSFTFVFSLAIS